MQPQSPTQQPAAAALRPNTLASAAVTFPWLLPKSTAATTTTTTAAAAAAAAAAATTQRFGPGSANRA